MLTKIIISLGLIIFNSLLTVARDIKWIEGLKDSVSNDPHIHQVIFLINKEIVTIDPIHREIIKKLSRRIPVREIVLSNVDKPTSFDFITYNPRISLFVLTNSENDTELTRSIDFLTQLSEFKRRPKCLLLFFKEHSNYREFFEKLWNKQFLDVTIIEIGKAIYKPALHVSKTDHFLEHKVFNYNPFLNMIANETASFKTIWFPDKLQNLHGYPLIGSLLHAPPYVIVLKTSSVNVSGITIMKIECLRKILNFTLVQSSIRNWGTLTCKKAGNSGVIKALFENKIQIIGLEFSIGYYDGKGTEFSKGLQSKKLGIVVPLIKKDVDLVNYKWNSKTTCLVVMILPFLPWIVSRILGFHQKKWRYNYLLRMLWGTAVPEEPDTTRERVMFAGFLIGCLMMSSEIYTSVTEVQLTTKSPFKFETLEDVASSNLTIIINADYFYYLKNTSDTILQKVLEKSYQMNSPEDECMKSLSKYKNVSCILDISRAEFFLRNKRGKCGQPLVKIISDKFPSGSGATLLGAGTPYVKRFDQVIQRLIDSGIATKWLESYSMKKVSFFKIGTSCRSEQPGSVDIRHQVVLLISTGYIFPTFIFILELLIYRIVESK